METLLKLREREVVTLTPYERETSARATEPLSLEPHDVVILEGILALYSARVRALLDLKVSFRTPPVPGPLESSIRKKLGLSCSFDTKSVNASRFQLFVDLDSDIRLSTRVVRDVGLGRELDTILEQYITMVKPAFEEFAEPTKKHADLVIPRGSENSRATELVKEHILSVLSKIDFDNNVMANSPDLYVRACLLCCEISLFLTNSECEHSQKC